MKFRPVILRLTGDRVRSTPTSTAGSTSLVPGSGSVTAVALQPDGKIIFTSRGVPWAGSTRTEAPTRRSASTASPPHAAFPDSHWTTCISRDRAPTGRHDPGCGDDPRTGIRRPHAIGALARYTADGAPDPTFGDGGFVTADARHRLRRPRERSSSPSPSSPTAASSPWARSTSGRSAAARQARPGPPKYGPIFHVGYGDVGVFRYLPDGRPDPSFAGQVEW